MASINFRVLVKDATGKPIQGAFVEVRSLKDLEGLMVPEGAEGTTNENGIYTFQSLGISQQGPFRFRVEASLQGYVGHVDYTTGPGNDQLENPPPVIVLGSPLKAHVQSDHVSVDLTREDAKTLLASFATGAQVAGYLVTKVELALTKALSASE
jgi:hypothetical protein